ncbi:MAG: hypothetical protein JRI96_05525 [Deltaproteobacteria bacterium]|nr:hypothetical protein [Deltaproteobacteria bacterium]
MIEKWPLYQYGKVTNEELEEKCKEIYVSEYIRKGCGTQINIKTRDGVPVVFRESRFSHAFGRERRGVRNFHPARATRVLWIKRVLDEDAGRLTILIKEVTKKLKKRKGGKGGRGKRYQRLYYVPEEEYLVVLTWDGPRKKFLNFTSHYPMTQPWKIEEIKELFGIK